MRSQTRRFVIGLLVAWCCAIGAASAQTTQPAGEAPAQAKFLRFVAMGDNAGRLEASVVSYRNKQGVSVDLIAAVHIADASFFHQLNDSFGQYDSLLYEMVKPRNLTPADRIRAQREGRSQPLGWVGVFQQFMKDTLELSFQLDEIDYTRRNFVHADLDMETFQQMQEDRGESMLSLMFQEMIHEVARSASGADSGPAQQEQAPDLMKLVEALQSPDRARQLKLVLARQFGQMDDMLSGAGGALQGSVILSERNRAALTMLRKRIDAGDRKIGIFYGAAHLKEMEKDLTGLMGFEQAGEPKWRTAWNMESKR